MRSRVPAYDVLATPEGAPVVLAGPPHALTGRLELHNPGEAKVVLRDAALTDAGGALASKRLRPTFPPVVLRPEQGRSVPLHLAVDPTTPPGTYDCAIEVAGSRRTAILHVAEVFDLSISPDVTVVENLHGEVQRKRLIVTNSGNVPFTVGEIGEVMLEDEMIWCRAQRIAIEPWVEKDDARLEDFLVGILKGAHHEAYRAGNLRVHNVAGEVAVAPGATAAIDVEITVPDKLHRNSRYRGLTPLFTENLEFLIVPSRGASAGTRRSRRS